MGARNYLVEGVSCTGKSAVCRELRRRGFDVVDGDNELAYQGDPVTGEPTDTSSHFHHVWDVAKVRALAADDSQAATFFCGGSRNLPSFVDVFDEVFVLEVDRETLGTRLDARAPDDFGATPSERELVLRLHATQEDVPAVGVRIDATAPLGDVVDEILRLADRTGAV